MTTHIPVILTCVGCNEPYDFSDKHTTLVLCAPCASERAKGEST